MHSGRCSVSMGHAVCRLKGKVRKDRLLWMRVADIQSPNLSAHLVHSRKSLSFLDCLYDNMYQNRCGGNYMQTTLHQTRDGAVLAEYKNSESRDVFLTDSPTSATYRCNLSGNRCDAKRVRSSHGLRSFGVH